MIDTLAYRTLFAAASVAIVCGSAFALPSLQRAPERESELRHDVGVFGEDDRKAAYDMKLFEAVQQLKMIRTSCTAFFVAREFALTAAHCLKGDFPLFIEIDAVTRPGDRHAVLRSTSAEGYAQVPIEYGRYFFKKDFGVVQVVQPVAKEIPLLEIAEPSELHIGQAAMSVGYPEDVGAGLVRTKDANCSVRGFREDQILTDCGMARGNSGGPLLVKVGEKWKVAGIASSQHMYRINSEEWRMVMGEPYTQLKANYYVDLTKYKKPILEFISGDHVIPRPLAPATAQPETRTNPEEPKKAPTETPKKKKKNKKKA